MNPAKKRDLSKLRTQIIFKILQHPATLAPLIAGIFAGIWNLAFHPTPTTLIIMIAGFSLGLLGAIYNLMVNGPVIRDHILAKWEKEADEEENLTKNELRAEIIGTRGSEDILDLYDDMESLMTSVRETLAGDEISEFRRMQFSTILEQNYASIETLFNRLAYLQKRLTNLLASAGKHDSEYQKKITEMRQQRQKIIDHLRATRSAIESLRDEVSGSDDLELEAAQRNLRELESTVQLSRATYQQLKDELSPIPGIREQSTQSAAEKTKE